jgi:hypothetical protein
MPFPLSRRHCLRGIIGTATREKNYQYGEPENGELLHDDRLILLLLRITNNDGVSSKRQ